MKILDSEKRFDTSLTIKKEWIPNVTFDTPYQLSIIEQFSTVSNADEKMLNLLKLFNSNIKCVEMSLQAYEVEISGRTKRLPLTRLSHGERLLALCLMADETKNTIYVSNELTQLSKPHILKLIEMFKYSQYINLVPPTHSSKNILDSLIQGGGLND